MAGFEMEVKVVLLQHVSPENRLDLSGEHTQLCLRRDASETPLFVKDQLQSEEM